MVAYSFKKQFVPPIAIGLGVAYPLDFITEDNIACSIPKLQTIRANRTGKGRHAREGETLQLYYAQRHPVLSYKIGESLCIAAEPIVILLQKKGRRRESIRLPGRHYDSIDGLDEFAASDGFKSWHAMADFWDTNHRGVTDFHGALIRWRPQDADGQGTKARV